MKITIHWNRVFALGLAFLVLIIAIWCLKFFDQSDELNRQEIGQCDMQEAQKIIDNLVRFFFLVLFLFI